MNKLIAVAFITESIWETLKLVKDPKGINIDKIGAIIIGIIIAVAGNFDLFQLVGLPLGVKYLGPVLTGLLISRGSNFLHDILGSVGQMYQKSKMN